MDKDKISIDELQKQDVVRVTRYTRVIIMALIVAALISGISVEITSVAILLVVSVLAIAFYVMCILIAIVALLFTIPGVPAAKIMKITIESIGRIPSNIVKFFSSFGKGRNA